MKESLLDGVLGFLLDWLVEGGIILIKLHEFGKIELGLLEDLDLSNHARILEWEDFRAALLLNLLSNFFFNAI